MNREQRRQARKSIRHEDGSETLSGPRAAKMFSDDPDAVFLHLRAIPDAWGFSTEELVNELGSGRLQSAFRSRAAMEEAYRTHKGDLATVSYGEILRWVQRTDTPPRVRQKVCLRMFGPDLTRQMGIDITH